MQSSSYTPADDLRDIIARHYVFDVPLPDDYELIDRLLAETAMIRILLKGEWTAELVPGEWSNVGPMVFFGPNSRPLRVRCVGSFHVVGFALRPGGWRTLFEEPADQFTDRMLALGDLWGARSDRLYQDVVAAGKDEKRIMAAIEAAVLELAATRGAVAPDPAMLAFERIARDDSTMRIADAAAAVGLSSKQLERTCIASFGMSPKRVLRRSRFLDMATVMRGLSKPDEAELAALRYSDQSHLNREFREFIALTPGQFAKTPTPLLTAGLELRNRRKFTDDF